MDLLNSTKLEDVTIGLDINLTYDLGLDKTYDPDLDFNRFYDNNNNTNEVYQIPMRVWGYLTIPVVVFAFLGNFLVICAVLMTTKLHKNSNVLIIALSITNGPVSSLVLVPYIYTHVTCQWGLGDRACALLGFTGWVVFSASCLILGFITIQRYCAIVWPLWFRTTMMLNSKLINGVFVVISYAFPFVIHLPVMFGVGGEMGFDPIECRCSMLTSNSKAFRFISKALAWGIPTFTMIYCYAHIMYSAYKNKKGLLEINQAQHQQAQKFRMNIRIAKMFGMCFLAYNILLVPTTVMEIMTKKLQSRNGSEAATLLFMCTFVVNPIIYGFTNKNYRHAYKNILTGRCMKNNAVRPGAEPGPSIEIPVLPSTSRSKEGETGHQVSSSFSGTMS
ncbi:melatonin receptor type 1B-B-like [Lingula anatina]|uniref:Melatonin receptor type 1B-B-like n=1 Tax=Lingula anatina TaxID=7574 RepID=A0A1S3H5P7_LINAN|nr:melatonin receptor type 1B-B-like [Lingula anatina]|eukprot:XP_013380791.1 melatonin receptor type 1B-B-like [Lingula anatina]